MGYWSFTDYLKEKDSENLINLTFTVNLSFLNAYFVNVLV